MTRDEESASEARRVRARARAVAARVADDIAFEVKQLTGDINEVGSNVRVLCARVDSIERRADANAADIIDERGRLDRFQLMMLGALLALIGGGAIAVIQFVKI